MQLRVGDGQARLEALSVSGVGLRPGVDEEEAGGRGPECDAAGAVACREIRDVHIGVMLKGW